MSVSLCYKGTAKVIAFTHTDHYDPPRVLEHWFGGAVDEFPSQPPFPLIGLAIVRNDSGLDRYALAVDYATSHNLMSSLKLFDVYLYEDSHGRLRFSSRPLHPLVSSAGPVTPLSLSQVPCSTAFVIIPGLKRVENVKVVVNAMVALHELLKSVFPPSEGFEIKSALVGGIVIARDRMAAFIDSHLNELAQRSRAIGLPIRIGITHDNLYEIDEVDQTRNFIGHGVSLAARLAFATPIRDGRIGKEFAGNKGCLVHGSYWTAVGGADRGPHAIARKPNTQIKIKGKPHDNNGKPIPCDTVDLRLVDAIGNGFRKGLDLQEVRRNIPAVCISYDLFQFSASDTFEVKTRVRALIEVVLDLRRNKILPAGAETYYSPGGDGGVLVLALGENGAGDIHEAFEAAKRLVGALDLQSVVQSKGTDVRCRVGLHYGFAHLFKAADGQWRPTGPDVFIADDVIGDEVAKANMRAGGLIVTQALRGAFFGGSTARFDAEFRQIPHVADGPARGLDRYVRNVTPG